MIPAPFSLSHPLFASGDARSLNACSSSRLSTVLSTKVLFGGEMRHKMMYIAAEMKKDVNHDALSITTSAENQDEVRRGDRHQ